MQFFLLTTDADAVGEDEPIHIVSLGRYGSTNQAIKAFHDWSIPDNTRLWGLITEDALEDVATFIEYMKKNEDGRIVFYFLPHFRPELARVQFAQTWHHVDPDSDLYEKFFVVEEPSRLVFKMELSETKFIDVLAVQPLDDWLQDNTELRRA